MTHEQIAVFADETANRSLGKLQETMRIHGVPMLTRYQLTLVRASISGSIQRAVRAIERHENQSEPQTKTR